MVLKVYATKTKAKQNAAGSKPTCITDDLEEADSLPESGSEYEPQSPVEEYPYPSRDCRMGQILWQSPQSNKHGSASTPEQHRVDEGRGHVGDDGESVKTGCSVFPKPL